MTVSAGRLRGGVELQRFLEAIPKKVRDATVRSALRAMAKPIVAEARLRAPKKSGKLARAIGAGSPRVNQDGTISIRVRLDRKKDHGFIGLFAEFGVRKHLISVQEQEKPFVIGRDGRRKADSIKTINKKVRSGSLVIGTHFIGPSVDHPGHGAHPFLVPALDAKRAEAVAAFGVKIREALKKNTGFTAPLIENDE